MTEEQTGGFGPPQHWSIAVKKGTSSEWYEVVIEVSVPEATERQHLNVTMRNDFLRVGSHGSCGWEWGLKPWAGEPGLIDHACSFGCYLN